MGHTLTSRHRRKKRGLRPSNRAYLLSRCQRCGASLADAFNAPVSIFSVLCNWCEYQLFKLLSDDQRKEASQ